MALGALKGDDPGCIASLYADAAYRKGNSGTRILIVDMNRIIATDSVMADVVLIVRSRGGVWALAMDAKGRSLLGRVAAMWRRYRGR